jgi:DeoR/GlpR family transcriptional regulator of sugar metabolism
MRIKENILKERLNKIRTTLNGKNFVSIEELSRLTGIPRSTVSRYVYGNLKKEVEIKSYGNIVLIKKKP